MDKNIRSYLPMTETAFYILLSLIKPKHGYGIILHVREITKDRITLGAGTIYGTLTKFEKDGLIESAGEEDRRKLYQLTETGKQLLMVEIDRIEELYNNGNGVRGELHD